MSASASRAFSRWQSLLVAWLTVIGMLLPGAGAAASQAVPLDAWATAFPESIDHDLPAMALPADAFPVTGLVAINGRMLRPFEEAAAFLPILGVDEATLLQDLRDTGWVTRHVAEVVRPEEGQDGTFERAGWSSIAIHESAAGAMDGFALLDEGKLEGVEVLDAPALGDASRLTRYAGTDGSGRSFERVRLTFVFDRLVGSVAFFWYDEARAEALAPDAMVEPAGVLLARMQSVLAGDAPNLPGMIVRLDPTAELVVEGHLEGYYVLDGRVVPWEGDTLASLGRADDFQQQWGVVAEYSARTAFVPQSGGASHPFYLVHLFRLESSADAAALVREHAQYDETLGYTAMAELESLPPVDGAVAGVSYTAPWEDGSENEGFRIWFQVGATVVVMEASDLGGVEDALMFQLVERQAACLEFGSCAPIPAPFPGPGPSATPAA